MKRTPFYSGTIRQYLVLATGILLIAFLACSKDSILNPNGKISNRTITPPDEYHGMLWFEDFDHIYEYYDYLNDLANASDDVDSTLALEEAALSLDYISLRSTVYKDSLIDREPAYEDWILDDVRTSILNSYREVRIGDSIYVNFSRSHYFFFQKDSATIMSSFRNAPKGGFYDSIPWELMTPAVNLISTATYLEHGEPTYTITPPPVTPRSPPFYIDFIPHPTMCDPMNKLLEFKVIDDGVLIGTNSPYASWDIDFGDGSTDYTGNQRLVQVNHTFPDFDTYIINVRAEFSYLDEQNVSHDVELDEDFEFLVEGTCGILQSYEDEEEEECTSNDDIKIERRFWYINDFLGQSFGARTTHLRRNNNGNWHKKDADVLQAHYQGRVRNLSNCEIDLNISETEHKTHARTARVSKNIDGQCDSDPFKPKHGNCKSVIDGEIFYRHISVESDGGVTFIKYFDACQ